MTFCRWWSNVSGVYNSQMGTKRDQMVPADLARAIRANRTALVGFTAMPPSHQQRYLEYIREAKRPETRAKRIAQAVTMMADWWRSRQHRHG